MKTIAIITAAGFSKRMGKSKQFLKLGGQAVLERTLAVFGRTKVIDGIILVVNEEEFKKTRQLKGSKIIKVVKGGKERQNSVYNGLRELPEDAEIVVIHDGARPFVTAEIIERAVSEAKKHGAVVVGVPLKDTIKAIRDSRFEIRDTLDRTGLWAAQTPQVFKKEVILKAYKEGVKKHQVTDDAMLVEKSGIPVTMVMGSYQNIKITTPDDLIIAGGILSKGANK